MMRAGEAAGGANSEMGSPGGICSAACPMGLVLEDLGATRAGGGQPPTLSGSHVPTLDGLAPERAGGLLGPSHPHGPRTQVLQGLEHAGELIWGLLLFSPGQFITLTGVLRMAAMLSYPYGVTPCSGV